jgi:hypothetical protein
MQDIMNKNNRRREALGFVTPINILKGLKRLRQTLNIIFRIFYEKENKIYDYLSY